MRAMCCSSVGEPRESPVRAPVPLLEGEPRESHACCRELCAVPQTTRGELREMVPPELGFDNIPQIHRKNSPERHQHNFCYGTSTPATLTSH